MHTSAFPLCNNADANAHLCSTSGHQNICQQLRNCVKKKTDVGGVGFLSPRGSNVVICWLSCLALCCSPSHGKHLFISTQVHLVFFKGAIILNANSALQWLSSKYNRNYCESQGKMLGVECSFQWQNKRHHLSSGGVKPLGWKCSAVYNCVCMHIPREKRINRWTHTLLTNRDTDLGGEGTFSQNICDYCPEGHAFRKKVCSI